MTPSSKPGLTVLTRDPLGNGAWKSRFARRHIEIYELPCIETVAIQKSPSLEKALGTIAGAHWLVFSSAQAVGYFTDLLESTNLDRRSLTRLKIAAVGQTTADAITARGLVVAFSPSKADGLTLANELPQVRDKAVMVIASSLSDPKLPAALTRRGALVTDIAVYETRLVTTPSPEYEHLLETSLVQRVIFASPSAVSAYWERLSPRARISATRVVAIAIGPTTAATLAKLGFTSVKVSPSPSVNEIMKLI